MTENEAKKVAEAQQAVTKAHVETVQRLQTQYAATGTVQAADMARILGNPVGGIEMQLQHGFTSSAWRTI